MGGIDYWQLLYTLIFVVPCAVFFFYVFLLLPVRLLRSLISYLDRH